MRDNVHFQHRMLTERLGIETIALATGWSMAGQQAYQWAVSYPDQVQRIAPFCSSARTSPHNIVFLEGPQAALRADAAWAGGWYDAPPTAGLRAFGRVFAGWALSQTFYREHRYRDMGYTSLEDFLVQLWEGNFLRRDANNLLSLAWTWQHADISTGTWRRRWPPSRPPRWSCRDRPTSTSHRRTARSRSATWRTPRAGRSPPSGVTKLDEGSIPPTPPFSTRA